MHKPIEDPDDPAYCPPFLAKLLGPVLEIIEELPPVELRLFSQKMKPIGQGILDAAEHAEWLAYWREMRAGYIPDEEESPPPETEKPATECRGSIDRSETIKAVSLLSQEATPQPERCQLP
ncbi:hypothetical protein N9B94_02210 [Verrucomicrobia bacterium]|nr:hypothetical protein [Verrucomicrobiota bacterium]